jgi:hypothetical protein
LAAQTLIRSILELEAEKDSYLNQDLGEFALPFTVCNFNFDSYVIDSRDLARNTMILKYLQVDTPLSD